MSNSLPLFVAEEFVDVGSEEAGCHESYHRAMRDLIWGTESLVRVLSALKDNYGVDSAGSARGSPYLRV